MFSSGLDVGLPSFSGAFGADRSAVLAEPDRLSGDFRV
jgi:hypothetical protein